MMKQRGITLVELMIVVAIVGILAGIAYPSYVNYVQRTNRSEAMNELVRIANLQEQFFADNRAYAANLTVLGFPQETWDTENGLYNIAVTAVAARSFTLTATAQGMQANDACTFFTIDQTGARAAAAAGCWR